MNRNDRAVIAGLVLVLVFAAFAIGGPAFAPTGPGASALPSVAPVVHYREGILGRPTNVNPLAARTQADRDLVALVFEGLVGRDDDARPAPALATGWTTSKDGATWTFTLDPTARWQDGPSVTAADVAFTIRTLQDPEYRGPGAGSWTGIEVKVVDPQTVSFTMATPIGGFLDLATQPIVPEHLLAGIPVAGIADDRFGEAPVGSNDYAIVELDRNHAILEPRGGARGGSGSPVLAPSGSTSSSADPLVTSRPTARPAGDDSLGRIELRFFDDAEALAAAFRDGSVDAVSGLDPAAAAALADATGARALRYPSTTVSVAALNLRPSEPTFVDPRVRQALLRAIDRTRIVDVIYGGMATRADDLIPPSSWAVAPPDPAPASPSASPAASSAASAAPSAVPSPGASPSVNPVPARDLKAAAKGLTDAGWTKQKDGWHAPSAKAARTLELLVPDRAANPILFAVGSQIAADWTALGFTVTVVERDPAVLVTDHLRTGDFEVALLDIAIGHDPDLYPLLASSQTRTGGANVIGLQDPALDALLEAARKPAAEPARMAAFAALRARLVGGTYVLPMAWPDTVVIVRDRVVGPVVREVADGSERFGDVLTWRLADDR